MKHSFSRFGALWDEDLMHTILVIKKIQTLKSPAQHKPTYWKSLLKITFEACIHPYLRAGPKE